MLTKNREQGTLHHQQCIDELTTQLDARNIRVLKTTSSVDETTKIVSPTRSETPTSFVTVIEVKDPSSMPATNAPVTQPTSISIANNSVDDMKPEPSYSPPQLPHKPDASGDDNNASATTSASATTTTTVTAASTAAPVKCDDSIVQSSQMIEVKRKIPPRFVFSCHIPFPAFDKLSHTICSINSNLFRNVLIIFFRPPPKAARRVGPVAESPSIAETPPSPSNTFNSSATNVSVCSSESNVKPSEFLRNQNHNDDKIPAVLLRYSQHGGSINKSAQNSSSESLINSTNNEEQLHVEAFSISERVCCNVIIRPHTPYTYGCHPI